MAVPAPVLVPSMVFPLLLLVPAVPPRPTPAAADFRELLSSARGIAPALCALAADGVRSGGWGGGWEAPAMPLASPKRLRLRRAHLISAEDARGLLAALAATDACERQLAATLLGQADKSLAPEVARRLTS